MIKKIKNNLEENLILFVSQFVVIFAILFIFSNLNVYAYDNKFINEFEDAENNYFIFEYDNSLYAVSSDTKDSFFYVNNISIGLNVGLIDENKKNLFGNYITLYEYDYEAENWTKIKSNQEHINIKEESNINYLASNKTVYEYNDNYDFEVFQQVEPALIILLFDRAMNVGIILSYIMRLIPTVFPFLIIAFGLRKSITFIMNILKTC